MLGSQPAHTGKPQDAAEPDLILGTVTRLARPRSDGGHVIERAAIVAAGDDAAAIEAWIIAQGGVPEHATRAAGGLHSPRVDSGRQARGVALRFLLPAGLLKRP